MSEESAYTLVFQSLVIESLQIVFYIEHVAVGYEKVAGFCFKDHISVVRKISVAVAFDCKHRDPGSLSYFIRVFESPQCTMAFGENSFFNFSNMSQNLESWPWVSLTTSIRIFILPLSIVYHTF